MMRTTMTASLNHVVRLFVIPHDMEDTNMSALWEASREPPSLALEENNIPHRFTAHDWDQGSPVVEVAFEHEQDAEDYKEAIRSAGFNYVIRQIL